MIGKIYYQETDYQHNIGDWARGWKWYGKADLGGGSLLGAGIHAVDALRWFAGDGPESTMDIAEVHAYSGGYRRKRGEIDYDGFLTIERETGENPVEDIVAAKRFLERL